MPPLSFTSPTSTARGNRGSSVTQAHGLLVPASVSPPTYALEANTQMTRSVTGDQNLGQLLTIYSGQIPTEYNVSDALKQQIQAVMNSVVLPLVKFVPRKSSEAFPSYDKPDLRSPSSCELSYLILSKCNLWNASTTLEVRAHWWMAIRDEVKKMIGAYRNNTNNGIKTQISAYLEKPIQEAVNESMFSRLFPKLEAVVEMAKAGTLTNLREVENGEAFKAFVYFCLSKTRPSKPWKKVKHNVPVSSFFTVYDEAFAIVTLENSVNVWEDQAKATLRGDVIEDGRKRKRKNMEGAKTVYTSTGRNGRSWTNAGMQRFSELVAVIETKRSNEASKLLEEEIIQEYRNEFYGNSMSGNSEDGNETQTDNSLEEVSVVAAGLKSF